ncbi:MAG: FkbM family methyltransferase [Ignavibacteriota bacterium]
MARLYSIERALSDRPLTDPQGFGQELQAHSAGLESIKSILADFSASSKSAPYQPIYLGKGLLLTKSARDLELICNSDDIQLTPFLIRNRIWEPNLTRLFNELLQPGMTYLEVGANIGYFTTLAASLVGNGGRVHAFEPNPTVFRLLGLNVAINHQGYLCTLEPLAVADSVGEREFYSFHYNISSSTLSALPAKLLDEFQERPARSSTRCTSLDAYYGVSETVFDFVKIDAEGAECLIFEGGREFFRRHIHASTVICLECNPPALSGLGTTPGGLLGLVRSYGFMVWKLEGDGDLIPVHDVEDLDPWCLSALVASRSPIRGRQAR